MMERYSLADLCEWATWLSVIALVIPAIASVVWYEWDEALDAMMMEESTSFMVMSTILENARHRGPTRPATGAKKPMTPARKSMTSAHRIRTHAIKHA